MSRIIFKKYLQNILLNTIIRLTKSDGVFGKKLGNGSYGSVSQGIDVNTGEEFAIKVIDKQLIKRLKIRMIE